MKTAVYPGSFDPITLGHIDIINRASKIFDELIVAVLMNSAKIPLFDTNERVDMIEKSVCDFKNVKVETFDGLLVDFMRKKNTSIVVRGLRAVTDYEYEIQLAQTNRALDNNIDTIFFTTDVKYSYLSSSVVKNIAEYNGDIDKFVTNYVKEKILKKYNS